MGCNHPNKAFWTGAYTENGKKLYCVMFGTTGDYLSVDYVQTRRKLPLDLSKAKAVNVGGRLFLTDPVPIPCGACVGCRMTRAKQWKERLCLEAERYPDTAFFITLTYDDRHVPTTKYGEPCVCKRDWQLFMKRLRKYSGHKYRYFACGEYGGGLTMRPHMHAIIFGDLGYLEPVSPTSYRAQYIEMAWHYGLTDVQYVAPESIAYVCGYVEKKQADPHWEEYPVKPWLLMSRMPGIGFHKLDQLDGGEDRKIYGDFGGKHYAPIPPQLVRKCENEPWFAEFKEKSEENAKKFSAMDPYFYGTSSKEEIGFIKDEICFEKLEKARKLKL